MKFACKYQLDLKLTCYLPIVIPQKIQDIAIRSRGRTLKQSKVHHYVSELLRKVNYVRDSNATPWLVNKSARLGSSAMAPDSTGPA